MAQHSSIEDFGWICQPVEVHLRTDANNLVTIAALTRLPEQKETIHMTQMLGQACSGQMHDLAHVLTQYCLADPLTKKSVSPSPLISTVQTGVLREVDTHPPFRSTVQHKFFVTGVLYPDPDVTEDFWTHLMCGPVFFKNNKGTNLSQVMCKGGRSPVRRESLTGRSYIYVVGPNGTLTSSTTPDKPLPSLVDMTGLWFLK